MALYPSIDFGAPKPIELHITHTHSASLGVHKWMLCDRRAWEILRYKSHIRMAELNRWLRRCFVATRPNGVE